MTAEHVRLRARLAAGLTAFGEAHERGEAFSPELTAEIREVIDELLQHELSETGLLQSQVLGECSRPHGEG